MYVPIMLGGQYATVDFDTNDANVACHQLGYAAYGKYTIYIIMLY